MGGLLTQLRPFVRQVWGTLAAPRPAGTPHLVYKRQVTPALHWIHEFPCGHLSGLTRTVHALSRDFLGITIVSDASPWGGGALLWRTFQEYADNQPAAEYLTVQWDAEHEGMINGQVGSPDHQASWEALAFGIALRTWVTDKVQGKITIIGDAQGVISNIIAMRSRAPVINDIIKEIALHLAPLGLDLLGLHLWAEQNEQADELSRLTGQTAPPEWLHPGTLRATPMMITRGGSGWDRRLRPTCEPLWAVLEQLWSVSVRQTRPWQASRLKIGGLGGVRGVEPRIHPFLD